MTRPLLRVVGPLMLAVVALQVAWFFTVPAFGGIDEAEHAFRAASVADGHWQAGTVPDRRGVGDRIVTRADLVRAAWPFCWRVFPANQWPDNCTAVSRPGPGRVTVADTAARYDPVFYVLAGTAARPFTGAAAVQVMRAVALAGCDVLLAAAVWLLASTRSVWMVGAGSMTLTPIVVYSTVVAAPNGLQLAGSVLTWAAVAALFVDRPGCPTRRAVGLGALGVCVTLVTHTLGPVWVVGQLAAAAVLLGRAGGRRVWARARRASVTAVAAVVAVGGAAVGWTVANRTNDPFTQSGPGGRLTWPLLAGLVRRWLLQSVATTPSPHQFGPPLLYLLGIGGLAGLLAAGFWFGSRRARVVLGILSAAGLLVPTAATWVSYAHVGAAWQGRYTLPLLFGVPLVAGAALARTVHGVPRFHVRAAFAACWAAVQLLTLTPTLRYEDGLGVHPAASPLLLAGAAAVAAAGATAALSGMPAPGPGAFVDGGPE